MDISAYQHMNIRMSTRGKRPLRNLTPSDKVRAIQRIHNGETKASVSRDIGVPESTLRGWCKNEQKLRFMCRQLAANEQLPMSMLENPPEKRTKYEAHHILPQKIGGITSFEDFAGYGRLPFNGMDFAANCNNNHHNNSTHAFLEKIAMTEFMKKSSVSAEGSRQMGGGIGGVAHLAAINTSAPAAAIDYSQLSMMQDHLNLLSLISPNLTMMPSLGAIGTSGSNGSNGSSEGDGSKSKASAGTSDSADENSSGDKNNGAVLSVKNWAKDTSEDEKHSSSSNNNSSSDNINHNRNSNDTNNNAVKLRKQLLLPTVAPEAGGILAFLPQGSRADSDNNNGALLEWCKVFNASLNFLALAAAAAALQPSQTPAVNCTENASTLRSEPDLSEENILYKQLTKSMARTAVQNDASNDSYYESEPEDLSVRSSTSKISSLANSRSQSPAKSTMSSSSAQSDADP